MVKLCVPLSLTFKKSAPRPKLKFVALQFTHDTQLYVPKGDEQSTSLEVLSVVLLKMQVFWYTKLHSWAYNSQYFKEA
jgi:hypothetical protein